MQKSQRQIEFDLMRTISMIFIICVLHFTQYWSGTMSTWYESHTATTLTFGALGIFSWISGYFNSKKVFNSLQDVISFYQKRLIRIYPLFLLATLLFVFTGIYDYKEMIFTALGAVGCLLGTAPKTLWYVCMLFLFYLLTPVVLYNKNHRVLKVLIITIALVVCKVLLHSDSRVCIYWIFYGIGILWDISDSSRTKVAGKGIGIVAFIFVIVNLTVMNIMELPFTLILQLVTAFEIFLVVYQVSLLFKKGNQSIYINKIITFVAESSFCAYLFHRPFLEVFTDYDGKINPWMGVILFPCLFMICFFVQWLYNKISDVLLRCLEIR